MREKPLLRSTCGLLQNSIQGLVTDQERHLDVHAFAKTFTNFEAPVCRLPVTLIELKLGQAICYETF